MKHSSIQKIICAVALVTVSATLFSFSSRNGGEGFEIYLNSRLVLQQFGNNMNTIKSIQLDERFSNDQLVVRYHHCGQTGKNRTIAIKDAQNKILKEWKFPNVSAASLSISDASMAFKVKDILNLQKTNTGKLGLYYTSDLLPKGRLLATLITTDVAKAK